METVIRIEVKRERELKEQAGLWKRIKNNFGVQRYLIKNLKLIEKWFEIKINSVLLNGCEKWEVFSPKDEESNLLDFERKIFYQKYRPDQIWFWMEKKNSKAVRPYKKGEHSGRKHFGLANVDTKNEWASKYTLINCINKELCSIL